MEDVADVRPRSALVPNATAGRCGGGSDVAAVVRLLSGSVLAGTDATRSAYEMKLKRWLARAGLGGAPRRSRGRAGGTGRSVVAGDAGPDADAEIGDDMLEGSANAAAGVGVGSSGALSAVVVVGEGCAEDGAVPYLLSPSAADPVEMVELRDMARGTWVAVASV
jgi:hypothetical protein